ncbi:MAG: protein CapI [Euryarchaeota archaeon]|nr:protein CapI [Euryarchaeota archaeon]|tara:strand:- start:11455 stop:12411 length:957 start_codon:yes stop_codon:yes gene_type:complete
MKILITGAAGFIGSQLMNRLRSKGATVLGLDNYNDHLYDPQLKIDRTQHFELDIKVCDLRDYNATKAVFDAFQPEQVIHLAAHANVRDSFGKERDYHSNNIDGTQNLIEICKGRDVRVIYATTSSVYGDTPVPENGWTEDLVTAKQRNAYAYTKYINEIQFAISGVQNVGLRFFTVYGPWGRPDMALFQFTKKMLANERIDVYNYGDMKRDFTYVEDILDGIEIILQDSSIESNEIFNIGRGQQVELMDFVKAIEKNACDTCCGQEADINLAPRHPADTLETWSNTEKLQALGYSPKMDIQEGVDNFYKWYVEYHDGR